MEENPNTIPEEFKDFLNQIPTELQFPGEDDPYKYMEKQPHECYEDARIIETKVFHASKPGLPCVQFILNFFDNHKVTVKMFMPLYPAEHSFYWLRDRYGKEAVNHIRAKIHEYIRQKDAEIVYWGF